jgi:hypothetical protein
MLMEMIISKDVRALVDECLFSIYIEDLKKTARRASTPGDLGALTIRGRLRSDPGEDPS